MEAEKLKEEKRKAMEVREVYERRKEALERELWKDGMQGIEGIVATVRTEIEGEIGAEKTILDEEDEMMRDEIQGNEESADKAGNLEGSEMEMDLANEEARRKGKGPAEVQDECSEAVKKLFEG